MSDSSIARDSRDVKGYSRLKLLTSSSAWSSPFRSGRKKNIVQEYKDTNDVSQVHVPKNFTTSPTLEAEQRKALTEARPEFAASNSEVDCTDDSQVADGETKYGRPDEPNADDTAKTTRWAEKEVEAINDSNHAAALVFPDRRQSSAPVENVDPSDDNIVKEIDETPMELRVDSSYKYEPVSLPNQAVLDSLNRNPKLLSHYEELNEIAIGSASRKLDDPNKVIDLGSGLKMSQHQLLEIAAKRVAPLITSINEEVAKSREEDEIVHQHEMDHKVAKHLNKLQGLLDKHIAKCEKQKVKIAKDSDNQLKQIFNDIDAAVTAHEKFKAQNEKNIDAVNSDYVDRKKAAVDEHENDKLILLRKHEELEATARKELDIAKKDRVTIGKEVDELKEKNTRVSTDNEELDTEIEELTKKLEEYKIELQLVKEQLSSERSALDKGEQRKKELNEKIVSANADVESKKSKKGKLALEVSVLTSAVASYTAHLSSLRKEKEAVPSQISAARQRNKDWMERNIDMAVCAVHNNEHRRLKAGEAFATDEEHAQLADRKTQFYEKRNYLLKEQQKLEADERARKAEEYKRRREEKAQECSNRKNQKNEAPQRKQLEEDRRSLRAQVAEKEKQKKLVEDGSKNSRDDARVAQAVGAASVGIVQTPVSQASKSGSTGSKITGTPDQSNSVDALKQYKPDAGNQTSKYMLNTKLDACDVDGTSEAADDAASSDLDSRPRSLKKRFKNFIKGEPKQADVARSDVYSLYEEVSDEEFYCHKGDPNYLEVETDVADKLLRKNRG